MGLLSWFLAGPVDADPNPRRRSHSGGAYYQPCPGADGENGVWHCSRCHRGLDLRSTGQCKCGGA